MMDAGAEQHQGESHLKITGISDGSEDSNAKGTTGSGQAEQGDTFKPLSERESPSKDIADPDQQFEPAQPYLTTISKSSGMDPDLTAEEPDVLQRERHTSETGYKPKTEQEQLQERGIGPELDQMQKKELYKYEKLESLQSQEEKSDESQEKRSDETQEHESYRRLEVEPESDENQEHESDRRLEVEPESDENQEHESDRRLEVEPESDETQEHESYRRLEVEPESDENQEHESDRRLEVEPESDKTQEQKSDETQDHELDQSQERATEPNQEVESESKKEEDSEPRGYSDSDSNTKLLSQHGKRNKEDQNTDKDKDKTKYQIFVIGKTGTGKSSLCNKIIGRNAFATGRSFKQVVDTPDISGESESRQKELVDSWKRDAKGYNYMVVLAVRCDARYSPAEYEVYRQIKQLWGHDLVKRLVVAFTFGDTREDQSLDMKQELANVWPELKQVIKDANNRFVVFSNEGGNKEDTPVIELVKHFKQLQPLKGHSWRELSPRWRVFTIVIGCMTVVVFGYLIFTVEDTNPAKAFINMMTL